MNKISFDGKQLHVYLTELPWHDSRVPVMKIKGVLPEDFIEIMKNPIDFTATDNVILKCEHCKKRLRKSLTPTIIYVNPEQAAYMFLYCSLLCKAKDEFLLKERYSLVSN